jgi:hypothetical protein
VGFSSRLTDEGAGFELFDARKGKPHLTGVISGG